MSDSPPSLIPPSGSISSPTIESNDDLMRLTSPSDFSTTRRPYSSRPVRRQLFPEETMSTPIKSIPRNNTEKKNVGGKTRRKTRKNRRKTRKPRKPRNHRK